MGICHGCVRWNRILYIAQPCRSQSHSQHKRDESYCNVCNDILPFEERAIRSSSSGKPQARRTSITAMRLDPSVTDVILSLTISRQSHEESVRFGLLPASRSIFHLVCMVEFLIRWQGEGCRIVVRVYLFGGRSFVQASKQGERTEPLSRPAKSCFRHATKYKSSGSAHTLLCRFTTVMIP